MKKILHVFHHLNNAGTEMVMLNLFENINRENISFEFLVYGDGDIENKFTALGGVIHKVNVKTKKEFYKKLRKHLDENKYDAIHIHMCGMMYVAVLAAKKSKIPMIIIHSHNGMNKISLRAKIKRGILDLLIFSKATHYFCCSLNAAKYLFPIHHKKAVVIYNGINLEKFQFNNIVREEKRMELGVKSDDIMILNVGRLEQQKNQIKILEIAKQNINKNWKFFIAGEGKLKDEFINYIKNNGLEERVFLLGNRNDVNQLMCASDLFLLTSEYEGLGIVLIESQTTGLKTLSADNIPDEANMDLGNFWTLNIDDNWDEKIKNILMYSGGETREEISKKAFNSQYNIKSVAEFVESLYEGGKA